MFAIQYVNRPGNGYGGYIVHDDRGLVFIKATSANNIHPLYVWLGNGNANKGRDMMRDAFSMPSIVLNPAQYNELVKDVTLHTQRVFIKEGKVYH